MTDQEKSDELVERVADIVAAYVTNNPVQAPNLPELIDTVHRSLSQLASGKATAELPEPAVPVKRSVRSDHIVCLEDGNKFKSLRRHLATAHGLTPEEYRERWNLPADYPLVAPAYSSERSELAKKLGLGRKLKAKGRGRTR
jgi:predicted transcriptional regulator